MLSWTRTLVVTDAVDASHRCGARIVRTPLALVLALEHPVDRVVLDGSFARDPAFSAFVGETCPGVEVIRILDRRDVAPLRAVA